MDEAAVLDAPELSTETIEAPAETTQPSTEKESAVSDTADSTTETPATEAPKEDTPAIIDGKRLSDAARATLEEIRQKDPKLATQLKAALFEQDALRRMVPGGVREVQKIQQTLQQIGGLEGIASTKAEIEQWNSLDSLYTSADPKVIDHFTDTPEGATAFQKLAPMMFQKFAALNPDGFSGYFGRVMVNFANQSEIPLTMARLADFIGDNPKALEAYNKIAAFFGAVDKMSKNPLNVPETKPAAAGIPDDERKAFEEKQTKFEKLQWARSADNSRVDTFNTEWSRLTEGRKLTDVQREAVRELYGSRILKAVQAVPDFQKRIDAFFGAKDQQGYQRYVTSIYKQEIPKALKAAIDAIVPGKPGPKPTNGAAAAIPGKPAAVPSGFTLIAQRPAMTDVDVNQTTSDMVAAGRAILKGGKRVQWKR